MEIHVVSGDQLTIEQSASWSRLQQADPAGSSSPFFRPEYTHAVASVRDGVEVAVLEEAGEPVGFFPFQRGRRNTAEPVGGKLSDFQGIVARQDAAIDARQLLRACRLTAWHFDHLITSQAVFRPYHYVTADSPYLDLSGGYEAYAAEQREKGSHTIPKTLQKSRKMARELGPLRFELHTTNPQVLAKLIDWKVEQYRQLKDVNYLAPDWTRQLLGSLVHLRTEPFGGMLSAMYVGDRLAAVHLGIRAYDVLHAWFPTYDPTLSAYSPGQVFWVELLQACAALKIRRIDLGKGQQRFKTSLMSAADRVAEGAIDLQPLTGSLKRSWLCTRDWIRSTPLRAPARVPARMLRRFQAWLATQ